MTHPNQTPWDAAILAKLGTEPYASLKEDDAIAAALNAETVAGPTGDLTIGDVIGFLALAGALLPVLAFAGEKPSGDAAHDAALGVAKTLAVMINTPSAPSLRTSDPAAFARMQGMLGALKAQEAAAANSTGITPDIHDGLLALCSSTVLWRDSIGAPAPLNRYDIERAREAGQ